MPGPSSGVNTAPSGTGTIETYCVAYGKDAPEKGYILGRLDGSGDRFVAMAPNDPALLADMLTREQLGRRIRSRAGRPQRLPADCQRKPCPTC